MAAALAVAHGIGLINGAWAPMTALLVLKPGLRDTQARGMQRLIGTIAGGLSATMVSLKVASHPAAMILAVCVAVAAAYTLQKAHYAVFTSAVTATIVPSARLGRR